MHVIRLTLGCAAVAGGVSALMPVREVAEAPPSSLENLLAGRKNVTDKEFDTIRRFRPSLMSELAANASNAIRHAASVKQRYDSAASVLARNADAQKKAAAVQSVTSKALADSSTMLRELKEERLETLSHDIESNETAHERSHDVESKLKALDAAIAVAEQRFRKAHVKKTDADTEMHRIKSSQDSSAALEHMLKEHVQNANANIVAVQRDTLKALAAYNRTAIRVGLVVVHLHDLDESLQDEIASMENIVPTAANTSAVNDTHQPKTAMDLPGNKLESSHGRINVKMTTDLMVNATRLLSTVKSLKEKYPSIAKAASLSRQLQSQAKKRQEDAAHAFQRSENELKEVKGKRLKAMMADVNSSSSGDLAGLDRDVVEAENRFRSAHEKMVAADANAAKVSAQEEKSVAADVVLKEQMKKAKESLVSLQHSISKASAQHNMTATRLQGAVDDLRKIDASLQAAIVVPPDAEQHRNAPNTLESHELA